MAEFLIHFRLSTDELVSAEVQADTQEAVIAGVERALQSSLILLRGIGARQGSTRVLGSQSVLSYRVRDGDQNVTVPYAFDLPA